MPGQLVITGLEYSVQAVFPDREPTDHEIRGKQLLSIAPPHLNTVRDRKPRSGTGTDCRLEIEVGAARPRLTATLATPPSLLAGEVVQCELVLTNTGLAGAGAGLVLGTSTPGLVSVVPPSTPPPGPLFQFPLLEEGGQFRVGREDGSVEQTRLDLQRLPGPELQPGGELRVPVWVRAPGQPGLSQHQLVVWYEGQAGQYCHQLAPLQISLNTQPGITATCSRAGTNPARLALRLTNQGEATQPDMETVDVVKVWGRGGLSASTGLMVVFA